MCNCIEVVAFVTVTGVCIFFFVSVPAFAIRSYFAVCLFRMFFFSEDLCSLEPSPLATLSKRVHIDRDGSGRLVFKIKAISASKWAEVFSNRPLLAYLLFCFYLVVHTCFSVFFGGHVFVCVVCCCWAHSLFL